MSVCCRLSEDILDVSDSFKELFMVKTYVSKNNAVSFLFIFSCQHFP